MFSNVFPNFGKGRILKKEMLENLRDYPRDFIDIYYKDFSNGVISGADLLIGQSNIIINRGIVKHNGRIYMLTKEYEIPYFPTNKELLIKIKFLESTSEGDFRLHNTKVFLDDNQTVEKDEIELGRFKLREGAILRSDYTDFYDFDTEFNTINIISSEYSGFKKSTLNPIVLRYFSNIILRCKSTDINDVSFAMQCLNLNAIDREVIIYYISNRLGIQFKEYQNKEIYEYLTEIARKVEKGLNINVETRPRGFERIRVE